jgi:hypothetical protein
MMMMFDNNMNTMDFLSANEAITGKAQSQRINADSNDNTDNNRRSSENSTSEESNNMFTKFAFPFKLHSILESAGSSGQESIISWLPSGKAFKIHKPKEFADVIMPQYFNQTKYRSFQRQLYIYGFDRVKDKSSDDYGAYFHELFVRGASDLCLDMQRKKIKGTGLSNEERRKKASALRANSRPSNKNTSKMQTSQVPMISGSQSSNSQSLFSSMGMNSLSSQLQQQTPGKVSPTEDWNSASTAAVLKSALQVQEFATRQDTLNLQNEMNNMQNNNVIAMNKSMSRLSQYDMIKKMGRRCSLGFVRGMGRRGSLLFDGDEVIFGDKKFHFTSEY